MASTSKGNDDMTRDTTRNLMELAGSTIIPVTPDDDVDLLRPASAINVAISGKVVVTTTGGDTASVFVKAGIRYRLGVTRIWATGTDAQGIVALA